MAIYTHKDDGAVWWTVGAQGGVSQPPYAIKHRGRWYRTLALSSYEGAYGGTMDANTKRIVQAMPRIPHGVRKCLDYLERTHKHFSDLPLFLGLDV